MVYTRSRVFSVAIGYSFSLVSRLQLPIASLFLANFAFAQASCTSCTQGLIALSEEALSPDRLAIIDIDHGNSANYSSGPTQLYTLVGEPHFNSNRGRFQVLDESGAVVLARSGSQAGSQISQRGTQEGAAVLAGADFNGDGIQDLIVGAPGDDVNGTLDNDAGAVYVYYGAASPSGVSNTPDRVLSIPGAPVNAHLGETLATTTLRSGQQVLLVGAPDRHSVEVFDFRTGRHRATVCAHDSFANTNFYGYSMVAHPTRSGLIYIGGPSDALGGKIELVDLNVADGTAGMACLSPNLPSRGAPCGTPGNSCIASINLLQAKIAMGLTPSLSLIHI